MRLDGSVSSSWKFFTQVLRRNHRTKEHKCAGFDLSAAWRRSILINMRKTKYFCIGKYISTPVYECGQVTLWCLPSSLGNYMFISIMHDPIIRKRHIIEKEKSRLIIFEKLYKNKKLPERKKFLFTYDHGNLSRKMLFNGMMKLYA